MYNKSINHIMEYFNDIAVCRGDYVNRECDRLFLDLVRDKAGRVDYLEEIIKQLTKVRNTAMLKNEQEETIVRAYNPQLKNDFIIDNVDYRIAKRCEQAIAMITAKKKEWGFQERPQGNQLPASQEPSTKRAKIAFKKALKAGYMEKTATGYKWLYNDGSKASLAYFLIMVYNPDNTKVTPFKALQALFGVTRLDRAAEQATSTKKPQQWREGIDKLL